MNAHVAVLFSLDQLRIGHDFDCRGPIEVQRAFQCFLKARLVLDTDAQPTATCDVIGDVGVGQGGLPHVPATGPLFLRDLSELVIVQKNVGDVHAVFDGSIHLPRVLSEASVTHDGNDRALVESAVPQVRNLGRSPGTHRRRVAETDRPEVSGHQHRLLTGCFEVAAEAVGIIADVHRDDRVARNVLVHGLEDRDGIRRTDAVGR